MINVTVVTRLPPTLIITFNRSVCLAEFAHVSIKVGDVSLTNPSWSTSSGEISNDKPASMWVCPLDNLKKDDGVQVELNCDPQQITFLLQPGKLLV